MLIASSALRGATRASRCSRTPWIQCQRLHTSRVCHNTPSASRSNSSTSSHSELTSENSNQIPPHRRNKGSPSRHKLFYRDIVPPMFRVLALGSAVYFSLHLIWQYLDGKEQKQLEDDVKREIEIKVRQSLENRGVIEGTSADEKTSKSWFSWATGK